MTLPEPPNPVTDNALTPQRPALAGGAWRVLHTRARQEKAVAEALAGAGVERYLPLVKVRKRYGHRKRESLVPLFPSYVFAHCTRESAWRVHDSGRVAQVIEISDQLRFAREIEQIRRAIEADVGVDLHPSLVAGRRVRVRTGPLRGIEGVVEVKPRFDRLILMVQTLGQAASVEIDADEVEAIDG